MRKEIIHLSDLKEEYSKKFSESSDAVTLEAFNKAETENTNRTVEDIASSSDEGNCSIDPAAKEVIGKTIKFHKELMELLRKRTVNPLFDYASAKKAIGEAIEFHKGLMELLSEETVR